MTYIIELLNHYGYIVLYIALTLELIAVPLPGETLLTYCGFLIYKGNLNEIGCIIFSTAGIITGITISYGFGRNLGEHLFYKYGHKFHMGPDKIQKASKWFGQYGNELLIIAYFIPGIRHITGYFSGVTRIPFMKFALNAYIGALIWVTTFILLGKTLGVEWKNFHKYIGKYSIAGSVILVIILLFVYLIKWKKEQLINFIKKFSP